MSDFPVQLLANIAAVGGVLAPRADQQAAVLALALAALHIHGHRSRLLFDVVFWWSRGVRKIKCQLPCERVFSPETPKSEKIGLGDAKMDTKSRIL